jgi:hypothetical protein
VLRVGEHVNGLNGNDLVGGVKKLQVTGLGGGVAAHIHNALWGGKEYGFDNIFMHAGARRVCDDDIGAAMLIYKLLVQNILHIASVE